MSIFSCPICRGPLARSGNALRCPQRHSFDLSTDGYVNLLVSGRSRPPGDSRGMIAARRRFLGGGYYDCLRGKLCALVLEGLKGSAAPALLDAGCGEGYYTQGLYEAAESAGVRADVAGIDIAKPAVRAAAKRNKRISYAVASVFDMPVADGVADAVVSVFAPLSPKEFRRVLRPGGLLVVVAPGARHLFGLKEFLYDKPYENEPKDFAFEGFSKAGRVSLPETIAVAGGEDLMSQFHMTPYFWRTPPRAAASLEGVERLRTEIDFDIFSFLKA